MSTMNLKLVRHLWDHTPPYGPSLPIIKQKGYDVIEVFQGVVDDAAELGNQFRDNGLECIWQCINFNMKDDGVVPSPQACVQDLKEQIDRAMDTIEPIMINCHTGWDAFNVAQQDEVFGGMLELEKELGITIAHETHRARCLFNPWQSRDILQRFPDLKLTCDFSHWVNVAERLLPDCLDIIRLAAKQCVHLHCRVGFEEGPQVPEPRAPEWQYALDAHEKWWDIIWEEQEKAGIETSYLCPEFGPPPYHWILPYSQQPISNLADICDWMGDRQRERFHARQA